MFPLIDQLSFNFIIIEFERDNLSPVIKQLNPAALILLGYHSHELINQPLALILVTAPDDSFWHTTRTSLNATSFAVDLITQTRQTINALLSFSPLPAQSSACLVLIQALQSSVTRTPELAKAPLFSCETVESALAESEQRFRQMAEMTGEWLWEQDPHGYYIYSSAAVQQILGFSPEDVLGKHYTQFLTAQDKTDQQPYATSHQPFYDLINHHRHKDGHQVLTESTGLPISNAAGNIQKWRGVDRDITARKHFQQLQVNLAIAQSELNIAQHIQASLLPAARLTSAQFEVTGYCLPADKIGGDYFDYFFRNETCLDFVIADVSGHAIGAALFMVETRSAIRTQANTPRTPSETLTILNHFLFEDLNNADFFITLFYLQYDLHKQQLSFANAGHPPPLLLSVGQTECRQLDADGLILGIQPQVFFEEKTVTLAQGDLILLYTDGLTEAENADGEFFGLQRLQDSFVHYAYQTPENIIAALLEQLTQFCQTSTFKDDITLLVFKRS